MPAAKSPPTAPAAAPPTRSARCAANPAAPAAMLPIAVLAARPRVLSSPFAAVTLPSRSVLISLTAFEASFPVSFRMNSMMLATAHRRLHVVAQGAAAVRFGE